MSRFVKIFGNMRFRNKLVVSTMAVALIPLLLFSLVIGTLLVRNVSDKSGQLTLQVVGQTSESLDVYIGTIEKLMDLVIQESDGSAEQIQTLAHEILGAYPEIAGITIAYSDDSYCGAGMTRTSRDLFRDESWYQYAVDKDGALGVIGSAVGRNVVGNLNDSSDTIFSLVKSFEGERQGVVLFDIRHDMIRQLINRVSIGENGFLYVVDDNDIVYTPANSIVYRIDEASYNTMDTDTVQVKGEDYFVANHYSSYSGWRIVGVIPESEMSDSIWFVYQLLGFCIVICLVLVVIVSFGVSATVTRPISKLSRLMTTAEAGDFSVRFQSRHNDEIGMLGASFNQMLERIDGLIYELYEEKQIRLEAQLKSLQEQIKPHFLYNTLDTISWMARAHGAMDVVHLVDALTNMFRVGLSSGRDFITLKEEKNHVTNYLYIQKVRYKDRLQYDIDIPEELDGITVPKLILQPLVENSIYHGVKRKRTGGTIRITGSADEKRLYLRVWDDGAGITDERLATLRQWLENPGHDENKGGFGLSYIAERIKLTYGEEYGMSIDSLQDSFTEVTVCLPR